MPEASQNPFGDGVTLPVNIETNSGNLPAAIPDGISGALLKALPTDIASALTADQQISMVEYMQNTKFGFTATASPIICKDEQCPFRDKCPLVLNNIERPYGKDCPVEKAQIAAWTDTFATAAAVDPSDPANAYDMMLVDQIVFQMLLEARAAWQLAMDPKIEKRLISGYNPMGQPFYSTETSRAAEFYEKMTKTKIRLLKELLATRKAKADAEAKGYADPSRVASSLMEKGQRIQMRKVTQKPDGTTEAVEIKNDSPEVPQAPKVPGE